MVENNETGQINYTADAGDEEIVVAHNKTNGDTMWLVILESAIIFRQHHLSN